MELIDRYVEQTVRLLPAEERPAAAERLRERIRSRIETAAAATAAAAAAAAADTGATTQSAVQSDVPEATVLAALQDLGPPEEAAASLARHQDGLIAPHLRRPFYTAVALSLAGLVVITLTQVLTGPGGVSGETGTVTDLLFRLIASLDDLLLKAVVVLTALVAVFVLMEHTVEDTLAARRRWRPRDLVAKDPDRVPRFGTILEIGLVVAILVALHMFGFELATHVKIGDEQGWVPLLSPALRAQIVWIDLWLVGTVVLDVALLSRGRWTVWTRSAAVALKLVVAAVLWRARHGGQLLAVDAGWMADHGWSAEAIASYTHLVEGPIQSAVRMALVWGLVVVLLVTVVEVARTLGSGWRELRSRL